VGRPVFHATGDASTTSAYSHHHRSFVARADDDVLRIRRAMHEVPRLKLAFLALDDQDTLTGNDQKRLL